MASTITQYSNLINVNFPVPGEDNDSQGFRSNFANIQSALSLAGKEISDIQVNGVNLSKTNDFGNNVIKRASLQNSSQVVANIGNVNLFVNVDYSLGSYQTFTVDPGTHTFTITNWPESGQCGAIRLQITPTSTDPVLINFGGNNIVLSKATLPVTYNQQTAIVWELWSPDNGVTIYAHELGLPNVDVTATTIVAYEDLGIGNTRYSVDLVTSSTMVKTGNFCQDIALVPCDISATLVEYGCSNEVSAATTTTNFTVDNAFGIKPGAVFWFNSITTKFTVTSVVGNTIYTQVFDRALLSGDPEGTVIRFISLRYNQPVVLNLIDSQPTVVTGSKYNLKGQTYVNSSTMWVAYADHESGTNQWLKVATQPGNNTFESSNEFNAINVFNSATLFEQSIRLPRYTTSELVTAPSDTGGFAFNTSTNRPVYYANGAWSGVSKFPTYTTAELAALTASDGDVAIDIDLGLPVFYYNGSWVQFNV